MLAVSTQEFDPKEFRGEPEYVIWHFNGDRLRGLLCASNLHSSGITSAPPVRMAFIWNGSYEAGAWVGEAPPTRPRVARFENAICTTAAHHSSALEQPERLAALIIALVIQQ